jgi:hypothetical protein
MTSKQLNDLPLSTLRTQITPLQEQWAQTAQDVAAGRASGASLILIGNAILRLLDTLIAALQLEEEQEQDARSCGTPSVPPIAHVERLEADAPVAEIRIIDRCPSCGHQTLFIGTGGYLTCSWLPCQEPGVGRAVEALKAKVEANAERPASAAPVAEVVGANDFHERLSHLLPNAALPSLDHLKRECAALDLAVDLLEIARRQLSANGVSGVAHHCERSTKVW